MDFLPILELMGSFAGLVYALERGTKAALDAWMDWCKRK